MRNLISNRTKIITSYILLTVFTASPLYAVESTMVVELQKRIHTNLSELNSTHDSLEASTANSSREANDVNQEFNETSNNNDKRYLVRRLLGVNVETLNYTAKDSIKMQGILENLIDNMEQLQDGLSASNNNGVSATSGEDMAIMSNTVKGMQTTYNLIARLNPNNENLGMLSTKLQYQNAYLTNLFEKGASLSIQDQIEYLMNLHATLEAGLKLIDRERYILQYAANSILKGELKESVFQIDVNIAPIYKNLIGGHKELFSMINEVNNGGKASRKKRSVPLELKGLGNFGN